jgi:hypothetical protein
MLDHVKEAAKTVVGGVGVAGTTHAAFDIAQATQYASFAAAVATTIYFIVVTYLAIKADKRRATNK